MGGVVLSIIEAIILGVFQGISEFLPISSSGHLALLQNLFGLTEGSLFFSTMLHLGTLLSIFIVFFKDIKKLIIESLKMLGDLFKTKKLKINNDYKKISIMIVIGSIPTALMGIFFEDFIEGLYSSLTSVAIGFILTGLLLLVSEKVGSGKRKSKDLNLIDAIIIGTFQGFAIAPGLSRSGSTIVGALFRGFNKKFATKFSFFLAIPAIVGASLIQFIKAVSDENFIIEPLPIAIGTIFSCITGLFAINILIKLIEKSKLHFFSYYLWVLGIGIIVNQIFN